MDNNGENPENTFLESPTQDDDGPPEQTFVEDSMQDEMAALTSSLPESPVQEGDTQPRPVVEKRARRAMPFHYWLLWLLALGSLAINLITMAQIRQAKVAAKQAIVDAIAVLEGFQQQTFEYNVKIDDTMVIDTVVPVKETLEIPIQELIEVRTAATVTLLDVPGIGPITHNVPVASDVPIDVVFEAPLDQDFHVVLPIPVQLDIPIVLTISETPLYETIDEVILRLRDLDSNMDIPLER